MSVNYLQALSKLKKAQEKPIELPPELKQEQTSAQAEKTKEEKETKPEAR